MPLDPSAFEKYREFMGEDADAFIADIVQTFLASAPQALEEMKTLIAAGKRTEFVRAAHTLKSNSATVGANDLRQLCETMELQGNTLDAAALEAMLSQAVREYQQVETQLKDRLAK
ncbi:MAG: Hpt domain-containing protein [Chloroflexota bacterium]|nr:Hpt domain-containing protein [Chloroflexota bacterium]MBI5702737.1 Hpt domain-containing protein [Chloroflexota bacterium]